jgi:hypothetical protein
MPDGGPLIPYTEVTGHFPATRTLDTLPAGVRQSPTVFQQKYVFRFPAKHFWRNRSMEQQHPTGGGVVDNRMAFTNGAFSVNWMSARQENLVASHRHEAAATKVAKTYANKLYGNTAKIYSYFWGCSGGGIVSMAAAENTTDVWDGVQSQCMGPAGTATYHSFFYTFAIPEAKREAIAAAAAPGGTGDIYAGLNDEEKAVLDEFISAGYPLAVIGNHFKNLMPLVDPIDIRIFDQTYEDDFWSKRSQPAELPQGRPGGRLGDDHRHHPRCGRQADRDPVRSGDGPGIGLHRRYLSGVLGLCSGRQDAPDRSRSGGRGAHRQQAAIQPSG